MGLTSSFKLSVAFNLSSAIVRAAVVFCFLCVGSCQDPSIIYDKFEDIPNHAWQYTHIPEFVVKVSDASAPYDLRLNLRVTPNYEYANLFMLVHQHNPDGSHNSKQVELKLAEPDGRWLGKGVGSLYSYQISYHKNFIFPDTGTFRFRLEQNMRVNPLKEVTAVGIAVKKPN